MLRQPSQPDTAGQRPASNSRKSSPQPLGTLALSSHAPAAHQKPPSGRKRTKQGQKPPQQPIQPHKDPHSAQKSPTPPTESSPNGRAVTGWPQGTSKGGPKGAPLREMSRQTLSIPEDAPAQPDAHQPQMQPVMDVEDTADVGQPGKGSKVITSAERPGADAPPPTPTVNLHSRPATGALLACCSAHAPGPVHRKAAGTQLSACCCGVAAWVIQTNWI